MTRALRYASRLLAGVGLAMLLTIVMAVPVFAAQTTITMTITGGPRTVSINPDFVALDVRYSEEPQSINGSATVTVDDLSGTGAGWHVTLQATDLIYSGADGSSSIPAANLAVTSASAPVMLTGQSIDAFGGPKMPDSNATGSLDQPRTVLLSNPDHGQGRYTQDLGLTVTIPAMSQAGSYTGTLIVSIGAGP